jgi:hypothetical protein
MTIELDNYGLMIDLGDFLYVSLSWAFLILSALVLVGAKVYNKVKSNRVKPLIDLNNNDDWMTQ